MLIWYDLVWNNNLGYVRLNGSYNILKSINFQVAGIPSLCKEKNMNMKSMSYTGKDLWTVWELDVEDYEILYLSMWKYCCIFCLHKVFPDFQTCAEDLCHTVGPKIYPLYIKKIDTPWG